MENNDVLRRLRYTFDYNDAKMIEIFSLVEYAIDRYILSKWLKKFEDPNFEEMDDIDLAAFLNGLIIHNRGKREGPQPQPEYRINNNLILKKLKIALNLKSQDIIQLFESIDKKISPHELSSFLRNPKQGKFRPCLDQYLRNFLEGIQKKHRPDTLSIDTENEE